MNDTENAVHRVLAAITDAWRKNTPAAMRPFLHADVTMVMPQFSGAISGRETLIQSFVEFCTNAKVLEYSESQEQIQVIGRTAIATFRFNMLYERPGYRERSLGRDLWVLERDDDEWVAVWRTMMELEEVREPTE